LGIGECGRKVGLELFRMTNGNALESVNKMHYFTLIDLAEPASQMKDVYKMEIPESCVNVLQYADTELQPESNLFIKRMRDVEERGVGGLWCHSKEIAEGAWGNFQETFKYHLTNIEWYNVFHSAGGGTGCGAGPVFLEKIQKEYKEEEIVLSEDLYTATLILPNEYWEGWRETNSAAAIGRHSRIAHGIIVADNLQGEVLVENAVACNAPIKTYDSRELINKRLAEVWISMQMTNISENNPVPKIYEAADYRRLFTNGDYAGVLVPCFREYTLNDFVRGGLNLKGAVYDTMRNHQLAAFELEDFENIIVIVTLPSSTNGLAGHVVKNMEDYGEIADMLQRMHGRDFEPAVIYAYSKSLVDSVKIMVFVKDPHIPRFLDLYHKLEAIIENPTKMRDTINKMFPKDFDRTSKNRIMQNAQEEFKKAYNNFSKYIHAKGFDNHRGKR